MNREEVAIAISIANFLMTWGVALYMYLTNKNKATNERISELEDDFAEEIGGHVQRIAKLETTAINAPSHADLAKMYESINDLAKSVNQMLGETRGHSDTLRLIMNQITEKGMR